MRHQKPTLVVWVSTFLVALSVANAASIAPLEIKVTDARPLAAAADLLEKRYGQAVTYEDPPWAHASELVPMGLVTEAGSSSPKIPAGSGFLVPYDEVSRALVRPEGRVALLQTAVDAHVKANQPGRFRVAVDGDLAHLIPTQTKNAAGTLTTLTPVLDTSVRLEAGPRPALEVATTLCAALSARGATVRLGLFPTNLLNATTVEVPGDSESARSHLVRLVQASPRPLTWRLFWEPNEGYYLLHLLPVPSAARDIHPVASTQRLSLGTGS